MSRMRSPNFPGLSLQDSINAVKAIWDKNRCAPISREAGAKDLGYTGLTGRSLKILGALNQYDLIENLPKGQMRVTKTAQDILIGFPEEIKRKAVSIAGRSPSLYKEIFDRFEGHIPGDNAVRSFLFQRGFTNEGVEKALKVFLETNRFVEINGVSDDTETSPLELTDPEEIVDFVPIGKEIVRHPMRPVIDRSMRLSDVPLVIVDGPLDFNLSSSGLSLSGKTNSSRTLRAFLAKLEAIAVLLPDVDEADGDAAEIE